MTTNEAQKVLDAVIKQIAGFDNPLSLEQFKQKFAYDIDLPVEVQDATTGESTWSGTLNAGKYITLNNVKNRVGIDDWILPARPINSVSDILTAWNEVNYATTERYID